MLKKPREELIRDVIDNIETNMNLNAYAHSHNYYNSQFDPVSGSNYEMPASAVGWPPEISEYIRRVAIVTATTIVDAIYTEQELEAKVENIVLKDEDDGNMA